MLLNYIFGDNKIEKMDEMDIFPDFKSISGYILCTIIKYMYSDLSTTKEKYIFKNVNHCKG